MIRDLEYEGEVTYQGRGHNHEQAEERMYELHLWPLCAEYRLSLLTHPI